jgi:two-component system alkaline phosphatase synthesis response regulator PhoP
MIVDDEMHLARILQFTLEHAGYDVVTAFDGREALDMLETESPDLVILDLMLPIVDGYKICNIMKSGEKYRETPVIILSARDFGREELEEPLNADLLMEKPFNTETLLSEISRLVGQ